MDVHPPKNGMYRYWSIAKYWLSGDIWRFEVISMKQTPVNVAVIFSGQTHHSGSPLASDDPRKRRLWGGAPRGPPWGPRPRMCSFICLSKLSLKMRIWCCWLVAIQRSLQQFGDMAANWTRWEGYFDRDCLGRTWKKIWFICQIRNEENAWLAMQLCNVHSCETWLNLGHPLLLWQSRRWPQLIIILCFAAKERSGHLQGRLWGGFSKLILRHAQIPAQGQCFGISQMTNPKP